jgi:hypothetical protein
MTPHLLLSGVGHTGELGVRGMRSVSDVSGVGKNPIDHPAVRFITGP